MLKINLSDMPEDDQPERNAEKPAPAPEPVRKPEPAPARPAPKLTSPPSERRRVWPFVAGMLVLALIAAGLYLYGPRLLSYFTAPKAPPSVTAPAPQQTLAPAPQPLPEPARPVAVSGPDPVFAVLDTLNALMPPRVWFNGLTLQSDGSYEIRGMAFLYPAMAALDSALARIGTVTARTYPARSASAETVYRFTVAGKAAGVTAADILDPIPADTLAILAASLMKRNTDPGVKFTAVPRTGGTYGDQDLPFTVTGSFPAVRKVLGEIAADGSDIRVFRLVIEPSENGRPYDLVRVRFSLRTRSPI